MHKKYLQIAVASLMLTSSLPLQSEAFWGMGTEIKSWGRKNDPTKLLKKTWAEIERIDDNVERYVKKIMYGNLRKN